MAVRRFVFSSAGARAPTAAAQDRRGWLSPPLVQARGLAVAAGDFCHSARRSLQGRHLL